MKRSVIENLLQMMNVGVKDAARFQARFVPDGERGQ